MPGGEPPTVYGAIHAMVRRVPRGRVATYGQIAHLVGRCTPRMVGYAMAALPEDLDVPWHRIINSRGRVSLRSGSEGHLLQRALLEAEGIRFDPEGRIDLARVQWKGPR